MPLRSSIIFADHQEQLRNDLRMLLLSLIIGIVGGIGAWVFKKSIEIVYLILVELPRELIANNQLLLTIHTIVTPAAGGLVVGYMVNKWAKEAKGHGVPEIIQAVNLNKGMIRLRTPFVKIIASALTIGSGGSAGAEGPIAQIGAGFASAIAKKFDLTPDEAKTIVIAGVSAGIASIFNTPLGAVLFGVEIIRRDRRAFNVLPLILASLMGTVFGELVFGSDPIFDFPTEHAYSNFFNIPWFIILGILIGLLSVFFFHAFYKIEAGFEALPLKPMYITALGGLMVGIIELRYQQVTGLNYAPINAAFDLQYTTITILILIFVKMLATSFTLGSGGSGGVFAPILFLGVLGGTLFGITLSVLGINSLPIQVVAMLGMAAMFAAATRAPLTAIVMTAEMVGDYQLFIPLMFSVISAWIVSRFISKADIYTFKLIREGRDFSSAVDVFEDLEVKDVMHSPPPSVSAEDCLKDVIKIMSIKGESGLPVVDNGHLLGIITKHDVIFAQAKHEDSFKLKVKDVCTKHVITVSENSPLSLVFKEMALRHINRMPVIKSKNNHQLVGWITRYDIMQLYIEAKSNKLYDKLRESHIEDLDAEDIVGLS